MRLKDRFVLISGSASRAASPEQLDAAANYVRSLTRAILREGGGLIVFAGGAEPRSENGRVLVFDWVALEELAREPAAAVRAIAVTSRKARSKMSPERERLFQSLTDSGALRPTYVADDLHTGGNIGDAQVQPAHAMVAIGGGKGTTDRAAKMMSKRRLVIPIESNAGSLSEDGAGASALHQQAISNPERFAPYASTVFSKALPLFTLSSSAPDVAALADRTIDVIYAESVAEDQARDVDVLLLTALPVELSASKLALDLSDAPQRKTGSGTNVWTTDVLSAHSRKYRIAIACFGSAGNIGAAATTAELIQELKPVIVVMVGIAAGVRGKCQLGDVVFSERVVAYEPAALTTTGTAKAGWLTKLTSWFTQGPTRKNLPRPEMYRLPFAIEQDLTAYLADGDAATFRIAASLSALHVALPTGNPDITRAVRPRTSTIASGEKLLRDPTLLEELRETMHGKIEVGEMEAAGVAEACRRGGTEFLIVRGISDFGDSKKVDDVHKLASAAAAIVAADFIRDGLALKPRS